MGVVGGVAEARDRVLTTALPAAEIAGLLERALLAADVARAGHLFDRIVRDRPIDRVCMEVIQPTLASVSAGRAGGRLTRDQEESVARFFREKLITEVNAVRHPSPDARRALVACPGEDAQDVGSMMLTLLLRARGWDVLDLGNSVPADRVPEAVATFRPHLAAFSAREGGVRERPRRRHVGDRRRHDPSPRSSPSAVRRFPTPQRRPDAGPGPAGRPAGPPGV